MESEGLQVSDAHVARKLFTPSPRRRRSLRGWRREREDVDQGRVHRGGFRLSVMGGLIFFLLCLLAILVTVQLNRGWMELTMEDVFEFFSNKPLKPHPQNQSSYGLLYFDGQPLFGWLGALPLAGLIGVCGGVFTFLFMFYDSDVPGNFPPTPVSPRTPEGYQQTPDTGWHLGYIFVPVNATVVFSLALFYLRLHMGLPLL